MLWQAQYDGLRDGRLGLEDFIETVLLNTPLEPDYTLLGQALGHVSTAKSYLQMFAQGPPYEQRTTERMERMLWNGLQASRADNDRARRWLGTYIDVASSKAALANLDRDAGRHRLTPAASKSTRTFVGKSSAGSIAWTRRVARRWSPLRLPATRARAGNCLLCDPRSAGPMPRSS